MEPELLATIFSIFGVIVGVVIAGCGVAYLIRASYKRSRAEAIIHDRVRETMYGVSAILLGIMAIIYLGPMVEKSSLYIDDPETQQWLKATFYVSAGGMLLLLALYLRSSWLMRKAMDEDEDIWNGIEGRSDEPSTPED